MTCFVKVVASLAFAAYRPRRLGVTPWMVRAASHGSLAWQPGHVAVNTYALAKYASSPPVPRADATDPLPHLPEQAIAERKKAGACAGFFLTRVHP